MNVVGIQDDATVRERVEVRSLDLALVAKAQVIEPKVVNHQDHQVFW